MIHYLSSSGQAVSGALTEIGKKQATLLGSRLKAIPFEGTILFAPDSPCEKTADILSEILSVPKKEAAFLVGEKENEALKERVGEGYQNALGFHGEEDLLFLAPREVCEALASLFELKIPKGVHSFDCALTVFNPVSWRFIPTVFDTAHLPYDAITLGEKSARDLDAELFASQYQGVIPLPDLSDFTGERILHIGDTDSATYPYFRKLIEMVKPQIILHTGDLADEVKLERFPERAEEYRFKAAHLIDIMRQSGANMILVVGNHDSYDILKELAPDAEILMPGSEAILSGVPCRLGHKVKEMIFDRKYCLYGHGMAGETWRYGFNHPGKPCRFNVAFGSFIYDLANDRFERVPRVTAASL
ncbi:MAG: metallophosphoesterase [Clostridia bacterium]|nr:metallophosphoesterase [Clostridia bacterium]